MNPSNNVNRSVSANKAPGYTKTVIGKDMSSKVVSEPAKKSTEPAKTSSSSAKFPASTSSSSAPNQSGQRYQDPNPMSSIGFAKKAKKDGLPFTSPVRPTF